MKLGSLHHRSVSMALESGMPTLYREKHIQYVKTLDSRKDELQYWMTAHLRLAGLYWGRTAVDLLGAPDTLDHGKVVKFVLDCYDEATGGFGAHPGHDAHIMFTLYAVQVLFMEDALGSIPDRDRTVSYIVGLQRPDGSVAGDQYGEIDTRFAYIAIQTLCILGELPSFNCDKAAEWLGKCQNFDGGFGLKPDAESHGAQAFTVIAALDILDRLDVIDTEKAAWWLSDRQVASGGLNGRPEKLPDVCYSWWALSPLAILGHIDWIDKEKLVQFILRAQDPEKGGIADREGDEVDVFHTVFGLAGLSLLDFPGVESVDPTFCLPERLTAKLPFWPGLRRRQAQKAS